MLKLPDGSTLPTVTQPDGRVAVPLAGYGPMPIADLREAVALDIHRLARLPANADIHEDGVRLTRLGPSLWQIKVRGRYLTSADTWADLLCALETAERIAGKTLSAGWVAGAGCFAALLYVAMVVA